MVAEAPAVIASERETEALAQAHSKQEQVEQQQKLQGVGVSAATRTEAELIAEAMAFQSSGGTAYDAALQKLIPRSESVDATDSGIPVGVHRFLSPAETLPASKGQQAGNYETNGAAVGVAVHKSEEAKLVAEALAFQSSGGTDYDAALQKLLPGAGLKLPGVDSHMGPTHEQGDVRKKHDADVNTGDGIAQAGTAAGDTPISVSAAQDDDLGQSTLEKVGQTNRANLRERRRRLAKARGQQATTKPDL
jgi:hypothetical protein